MYGGYVREIFHGRLGVPVCDLFGIYYSNHLIGYPNLQDGPTMNNVPGHDPGSLVNSDPGIKINPSKAVQHDFNVNTPSRYFVHPGAPMQTPIYHPMFAQGFVPSMNPIVDPTFNPAANPFPLNPYLMNPFLFNPYSSKHSPTNSRSTHSFPVRTEVNHKIPHPTQSSFSRFVPKTSPRYASTSPSQLRNRLDSISKSKQMPFEQKTPQKLTTTISPILSEGNSRKVITHPCLPKISEETEYSGNENTAFKGEKSTRTTKFTVTPVIRANDPPRNEATTILSTPVFNPSAKQRVDDANKLLGIRQNLSLNKIPASNANHAVTFDDNVNVNVNNCLTQYTLTSPRAMNNNTTELVVDIPLSTSQNLSGNNSDHDNINSTVNTNQFFDQSPIMGNNQMRYVDSDGNINNFNSPSGTQSYVHPLHSTPNATYNLTQPIAYDNFKNNVNMNFSDDTSSNYGQSMEIPEYINNGTSRNIDSNKSTYYSANNSFYSNPNPVHYNNQLINNSVATNTNTLPASNLDLMNHNTNNFNTNMSSSNPSINIAPSNINVPTKGNFNNAIYNSIINNKNMCYDINYPTNSANIPHNINENICSAEHSNKPSNLNSNANSNANPKKPDLYNPQQTQNRHGLQKDELKPPFVNPVVGGCFPSNSLQPNNTNVTESKSTVNYPQQQDGKVNYQQMNQEVNILLNELIANQQLNQLANQHVGKMVNKLNDKMAMMSNKEKSSLSPNTLIDNFKNNSMQSSPDNISYKHYPIPPASSPMYASNNNSPNSHSDGITGASNILPTTKLESQANNTTNQQNNTTNNYNILRRVRSETSVVTTPTPDSFPDAKCSKNQFSELYNPYTQWGLIPPSAAMQEWLNSDLVKGCLANSGSTYPSNNDIYKAGKDNITKSESKEKDTRENIAKDDMLKDGVGDEMKEVKCTMKENKKMTRTYDFDIVISEEIVSTMSIV